MNEQNLIYGSMRSQSESRENGRKGGIASGKARLRKKHGRELLRLLLSMPETDSQMLAELEGLGLNPKEITNEVAMHARQIQKAKRKADTNAYNAVFKAAGYTEDEERQQGGNVTVVISQAAADAATKWSTKK